MKYFLFDLSVLACIVAVALNSEFVRDRGTSLLAPVCGVANDNQTNEIATARRRRFHQQQHDNAFEVGDVVEVYEPKIHESYAFYAEVLRADPQEDGSNNYKIRTLLTRSPEIFNGVNSSRLRRFEKPFKFGTRVMCTYGDSIDASEYLAPCTILSHFSRENGAIVYYVLENLEGELNYRKIPMSKV